MTHTPQYITEQLATMLSYPFEQRNGFWKRDMAEWLPAGYFRYNRLLEDDETPQRKCLGIVPTEYTGSQDARPLVEFAMAAAEDRRGLMVLNGDDPNGHEHIISYGSVWSYLQFDYLLGPVNLVKRFDAALQSGYENPMQDVMAHDTGVTLSEPSLDYLPKAPRLFITEQIQSFYPDASVDFYLYEEHDKVMPMSLMLHIQNVPRDIDPTPIGRIMAWNTPPLLRSADVVYDGDIKKALFGDMEATAIPTDDANRAAQEDFNNNFGFKAP